MSSHNRKNWLLLLLIVLVSHASLVLHVNSHVADDQRPCEICTHYSNAEQAIAPSLAASFPLSIYIPETFSETARLPEGRPAPYRQRAPPHAA